MKPAVNNPELENYTLKEVTVSAVQANLQTLAFIMPILLILGLPYVLLWREQFGLEVIRMAARANESYIPFLPLYLMGLIVAGVVVHELLHGITWAAFCRNGFRSISFGVQWQALTPYCHCKEPLRLRQYAVGGMMPGLVMGFIPAVYGILMGSMGWWLFGLFFSIAAGGDLLILWMLRKQKSTALVQDHPDKIGCFVFTKTT